MAEANLRQELMRVASDAGAECIGVALHDYEHNTHWGLNADVWFHAASTIKVPVLLGVFAAIERGELELYSRVHVRNRFLSVVDGTPYRIEAGRDANGAVHAAIGRTMQVAQLARHMIATSSNLATNLLIDVVGIESIRQTLRDHGLTGIEVRRGVEDEAGWREGINNRVTAGGLCRALRLVEERRAVSASASESMLEILHDQQFRSGIPAGLPEDARVAHKTGEMSTVAHDAGIVYLRDRAPYVVVILTQWHPERAGRQSVIAGLSRAIFTHVTAGDGDRD
jgi:beta-lactamase class A